jgi:hypothetical protein
VSRRRLWRDPRRRIFSERHLLCGLRILPSRFLILGCGCLAGDMISPSSAVILAWGTCPSRLHREGEADNRLLDSPPNIADTP